MLHKRANAGRMCVAAISYRCRFTTWPTPAQSCVSDQTISDIEDPQYFVWDNSSPEPDTMLCVIQLHRPDPQDPYECLKVRRAC